MTYRLPRLRRGVLLLPVLFLTLYVCVAAQERRVMRQQPDLKLDAAARARVIEAVLAELDAGYVFPDVAKQMGAAVRERVKRGEYDQITDAAALCWALTAHLQAVSRDKHLRVGYRTEKLNDATPLPGARVVIRGGLGDGKTPPPGAVVVRRGPGASEGSGNAGLEKVEKLTGNLGYLQFSYFAAPDEVGDEIDAAMNRLADTDALIIDLRQNRGGAQETIAHLMSYFFDKPVHLNDYYQRPTDTTRAAWTSASVPGKHYGDKDVYILTSSRTFSAGESISYSLKHLKRATLVGETTGGGAHPVMARRVGDHFFVMIPFARYVSAVTKANWEGVGVKPDVEVPAEQALALAQLAALRKLSAGTTDAKVGAERKARIEALQKELDALKAAAKRAELKG